jgi:hypothetical protein
MKLDELVKSVLLSEEEVKRVKKYVSKDTAIGKLLELNAAFDDLVLGKPILIMLNHIEFIETCQQEFQAHLKGDNVIVTDEESGVERSVSRSLAMLSDKSDGTPDRMKDMIKELRGLTEDVLSVIAARRVKMKGVEIESKEIEGLKSGKSWTDLRG